MNATSVRFEGVQLHQDAPDEHLDGAFADLELVRDDLVRLALTQSSQDFGFAWRRACERTSVEIAHGPLRAVLSILRDPHHGTDGHERAARRDALQRRRRLGRLEDSRDVAAHAMLDRLDDIIDVVAIGYHDQRDTAHVALQ
jgi:hypothetical protein